MRVKTVPTNADREPWHRFTGSVGQRRRVAMVAQTAHRSAPPLIRLVAFRLGAQRYGLELAATERVLPMVAVSPLPGCPEFVLGAINVHGDVLPVVDLRRRLDLRPGDYGPSARLLVTRTPRRLVALPADDVIGVVEVAVEDVLAPEAVLPGIGHVKGIAALADGLLLIQDLDALLSIDDETWLGEALAEEKR